MSIRDENRALFELLDRYFASKVDMIWPRGQMLMQPFALDAAETGRPFKIEGDFLYIDKTSTGSIYVQFGPGGQKFPMGPNMFFKGIAYRDLLISWDAQAGKTAQLWYGWGGEIIPPNQDITAIGSITNPVAIEEDTYGASFASVTATGAASNLTIVAPGTNVNGLDLKDLQYQATGAAGQNNGVLAKAGAAPASLTDGDLILVGHQLTGNFDQGNWLPRKLFIAATKGLYLRTGAAGEASKMLSALYTVL